MAWLRRGFSLYESLERVPLKVMRDDLTRLGVTVAQSRVQLAKQYVLQQLKPETSQAADTALPPHLAVFSTAVLRRELRRRHPEISLSGTESNSDLLSLLRSTQSNQGSGLQKMLGETQLTAEEAVQVLPQLADIAWLPQNDWNVLRESQPESLVPLWKVLFQDLNVLTKDQFVTLVQAACSNLTTLNKPFSQSELTQLPENTVTQILTHALTLKHQLSYQDIAHVVRFHQLFSQTGQNTAQTLELRNEVLSRLGKEDIKELPYSVLSEVYFLLPDNSYDSHSAAILSIQQQLFPPHKPVSSDFAWQCIHQSLRLHSPVPRILLQEPTILTPVHLRHLPSTQLLQLLESLLDTQLLSENVVKNVSDMCYQSLMLPESASLLVEMHYLLHRKGAHGLALKKLQGAQALATRSEYKLSVGQLLKLGVAVYPHIGGDAMSRRLLEELSNVDSSSAEVMSHQDLLPELLSHVVASCSEKPIYSYQHFSYISVESDLRFRLAERLAALILQLKGDVRPVWRFYSQALLASSLPQDLLQNTAGGHSEDVAYCLWRFHSQIPHYPRLISDLISSPNLSLQALFYLSHLTSPASLTPTFLQLLDKNIDSAEFFLPLIDILTLDLAHDKSLLKVYEEKILDRLHPGALVGQALYRSIIQLNKLKEWKLLSRLTQGLSFRPGTEPAAEGRLLESLGEALLSAHPHSSISVQSVATLFSESLHSSERARNLVSGLVLGEDVEESVAKKREEQDFAKLQNAKGAEMVELLARLPGATTTSLYSQALSFVAPSTTSVAIFDALEEGQVLQPRFLQGFLNHLGVEKNPTNRMQIARKLLSYLAVVGVEDAFQTLKSLLQSSLDQMDPEMAINYTFLSLNSLSSASQLPSSLLSKVFTVVPQECDDSLQSSSIPPLKRYLPFDFNYELDPRTIQSNNFAGKDPELVFQKRALLTKKDAVLIARIRAIKNVLKLNTSNLEDSALTTLRAFRMKTPELQEFSNDLEFMSGDKSHLKSAWLNYRHEFLGWDMDAAFPKQKVGMMLYLDRDTIRSPNGSPHQPSYLTRLQKTQLERLGHWTILGLRFSAWRNLSREKRREMLNHILHKFTS